MMREVIAGAAWWTAFSVALPGASAVAVAVYIAPRAWTWRLLRLGAWALRIVAARHHWPLT
jgi:hypothetical protein